jgi:hypothetical protein
MTIERTWRHSRTPSPIPGRHAAVRRAGHRDYRSRPPRQDHYDWGPGGA